MTELRFLVALLLMAAGSDAITAVLAVEEWSIAPFIPTPARPWDPS